MQFIKHLIYYLAFFAFLVPANVFAQVPDQVYPSVREYSKSYCDCLEPLLEELEDDVKHFFISTTSLTYDEAYNSYMHQAPGLQQKIDAAYTKIADDLEPRADYCMEAEMASDLYNPLIRYVLSEEGAEDTWDIIHLEMLRILKDNPNCTLSYWALKSKLEYFADSLAD